MEKPPMVLAPLDGTPHATVALPVAQTLAELEGGVLHVLHVTERTIPPRELLGSLGLTQEELYGTVLDLETGTPAEVIVRLAGEWRSPLIVICTHTGMEKPYGALGHVAEAVLCKAPCPVVLVQPERGHKPWELHRILFPHDGAPTTVAAIGPAIELARKAPADLIVLHAAVRGTKQPAEPGSLTVPLYVDQPQHEWPAWAQEFLDRVGRLGHLPGELRMRLVLARGEPGAESVRFARDHDIDLIVLAWHGRMEPPRAETLKTIIHQAPCPVMAVRVEERVC